MQDLEEVGRVLLGTRGCRPWTRWRRAFLGSCGVPEKGLGEVLREIECCVDEMWGMMWIVA